MMSKTKHQHMLGKLVENFCFDEFIQHTEKFKVIFKKKFNEHSVY